MAKVLSFDEIRRIVSGQGESFTEEEVRDILQGAPVQPDGAYDLVELLAWLTLKEEETANGR